MNIYGESSTFSTEVSVTLADIPAVMDIVTTSIDSTNVKVVWTKPDDSSNTITGYHLRFKNSAGSYVADTYNAGCRDADVTGENTLTCSTPMIELTTLLGLGVGTLIEVRIIASNARTTSTDITDSSVIYSQPNTSGAKIETKPLALTSVSYDATSSSETQIVINWTAPSGNEAGGDGVAITGYRVSYDNASGGTYQDITPDKASGVLTHT